MIIHNTDLRVFLKIILVLAIFKIIFIYAIIKSNWKTKNKKDEKDAK